MKIILFLAVLFLIKHAASQCGFSGTASDQVLLSYLGIQETCSTPVKNIITCDSSNRLISIVIPENYSFPISSNTGGNLRADNLKLYCASRLTKFAIPSKTFNRLVRDLNENLPNSLTELTLNYQSITDFPALNNYPSGSPPYMNRIEISFNTFPVNFNDVSKFRYPTLKTLILRGSIICNSANPADNFKCFPDSLVPALQYLDLSNNDFTAVPSNIFALSNLNTLILSNNRIVGSLSLFPHLTNLVYLDISNNSFNGLIPKMPSLTTFLYDNNNFNNIAFTGAIKVTGITIADGSSNVISPSTTPQIGALNIDTTSGYKAQLSLTGQPFTGFNANGIKMLISNYSGQSNVILCQNANGETDFSLLGGTASSPATFRIAGGATFYSRLINTGGCQNYRNAQQIIIGPTARSFCDEIDSCSVAYTAIYPAKDNFGILGLAEKRWFEVWAYNYYGSFHEISDKRVKENITPLTNVLEKVKQLSGYSYNLKASYTKKRENKKTIGLISQQVQKVFPEVVHEQENHLYISYPKLVPVLVESAKELAEKQDILESTNIALNAKVAEQEKKIDQLMDLVAKLSATVTKLSTLVGQQGEAIQHLSTSQE